MTVFTVVDFNLEHGFVVAGAVRLLNRYGGEFLVGGEEWRGDIVSEQECVGHEVAKTNVVAIPDMVAQSLNRLDRDNLPEVVGVVVGVSSDLLSLRGDTSIIVAEWVLVHMRVQVNLGILVSHGNVIKVINAHCILCHDVVRESLLESRSHEIVTGSRAGENGEMNLEPEEVHQEGNHNQPSHTRGEVVEELLQAQCAALAVDIHQFPQIDQNWHTHGEEGEGSHIFRANDTAHADSRQKQPLPPLPPKRIMSELVESNVAENAQCHEQYERRVEEDEARLADVSVVEEHQGSGDEGRGETVAGFPHDQVDDGNGEGSHQSGHRSVGDVGDVVVNIGIADVLKEEASIISHQPSRECEQELAEWRVNIEEVRPLQVV